jgi:rhodanese-related sulfurtransferase
MKYDQPISLLDAGELMESEHLLILDLRDPVSFRCGHIPKAINLGLNECHTLLLNLNKELPLLFYCDGDETAQVVAGVFAKAGFSKCFYLSVGYDEWQSFQQCSATLSPALCHWLAANGYDGLDLSKRGFNDETPLMTAARKGLYAFIIELIDHGADINAVNADGNSAVWLACYCNSIYALTVLIQEGAALNIQNVNGATPLIYAASAGRFEMVRMLISAGADSQLVTLDGFTALDVAATWNIVKLLRHVGRSQPIAAQPFDVLKKVC